MRVFLVATSLLALTPALWAAGVPSCESGARSFLPCELTFTMAAGDVPDPYNSETLRIEFRSPSHSTKLIRSYATNPTTLKVRFSPTEAGAWTYHVTGDVKSIPEREGSFQVADSGLPGFFDVANVRHWWTTNKRPHFWMAARATPAEMTNAWLDARKHDGFTHVTTVLLSGSDALHDGHPNEQYFATLDEHLLAAANRGFALDLILADETFLASTDLSDYSVRQALLRYLVARYGSLDVSWQGLEQFESVQDGRAALKNIAELLNTFDMYHHPRSTDARDSSSALMADNWENFLIESSRSSDLAAVEHQFTAMPEIHVVSAVKPEDFRREIWVAATNGEYIEAPARALENAANVKSVEVFARVMNEMRHWELEPYFDVDGARAVGLNEVEYIAYAEKPGIVEITLPKHRYNPFWIDPATGEEIPIKDFKADVFSQQTPEGAHDWILEAREEHNERRALSYRFEVEDPPIQEPEVNAAKTPFEIVDPPGDSIPAVPPPYGVKLVRPNRATRVMQYVWWGEIAGGNECAHLLGVGAQGTLQIPAVFLQPGTTLNIRLLAINANGKAYEMDKVYTVSR